MFDFGQNGMYGNNPNTVNKPTGQTPCRTYYFVNGVEGAKAYPVMPNNNVMLMDSENLLCYQKVADNVGKCTVRYFKLEEIDEATARKLTQPEIPADKQYATKNDINELNHKMDELFKMFGNKTKQEGKQNNK